MDRDPGIWTLREAIKVTLIAGAMFLAGAGLIALAFAVFV